MVPSVENKDKLESANQDGPETADDGVPAYYKAECWRRFSKFYDFLVWLFFLPFGGEKRYRARFVNFIAPQPEEQVLDICCGTGTLTALVAGRLGKKGRVTGVDLSAAMIARAHGKVADLAATFKRADVQSLPFAPDSFDKEYVSFGLHELPADVRQATLGEMYRTLKAGGGLFVFDYNLSRNFLPRLAIKAFVRTFEEADAYQMLLEGILSQIEAAGFQVKERRPVLGGMFQMIHAEKPAGKGDG
jgi:demethylmenaquinone methyltransferase/2-methoxy-6-polyprenyl-1,4-benzoquinol methylase